MYDSSREGICWTFVVVSWLMSVNLSLLNAPVNYDMWCQFSWEQGNPSPDQAVYSGDVSISLSMLFAGTVMRATAFALVDATSLLNTARGFQSRGKLALNSYSYPACTRSRARNSVNTLLQRQVK